MRHILAGTGILTTAVLTGLVFTGLVISGPGMQVEAAQDAANTPAFYTSQVRPIFQAHCAMCHMGTQHDGGLSLQSKASTMKGGHNGAVIVPGNPDNSLLVKLIRHQSADGISPMPLGAPKLSDANIATIVQWVKAGAVMPNDPQH